MLFNYILNLIYVDSKNLNQINLKVFEEESNIEEKDIHDVDVEEEKSVIKKIDSTTSPEKLKVNQIL